MQFRPTATLAKDYFFIYHRDPSLNQEAEGLTPSAMAEALEGNHRDRIAAWTKPGKKGPTEFKLRHLPSTTLRAVEGFAAQHGFPLAVHRLCAMALLEIINPDGQPVTLDRSARDSSFLEQCLTDACMEMLERAGCDEGLAKGEVVNAIGLAVWNARERPGN